MWKMAIADTIFFRAVGGGRTRGHRREKKKKRKVEVTDKRGPRNNQSNYNT
jgi:hypothetical protein